MKAVAGSVLNSIDDSWNQMFNTPFTKVLPKVVNLTPRKNKITKQKSKRGSQRIVKRAIENMFMANGRDVATVYGTRQSGSAYQKQRANLFMEPKIKAVERSSSILSYNLFFLRWRLHENSCEIRV